MEQWFSNLRTLFVVLALCEVACGISAYLICRGMTRRHEHRRVLWAVGLCMIASLVIVMVLGRFSVAYFASHPGIGGAERAWWFVLVMSYLLLPHCAMRGADDGDTRATHMYDTYEQ